MKSTTFTVRVDTGVKKRLERLAKSTGRSRSFLAAEANRGSLPVAKSRPPTIWTAPLIRATVSALEGTLVPTGSGNFITIEQVAEELSRRLCRIFLRDENGRRPVFGDHPKLQNDPDFRDHVLFYEYFHGDTGRGFGASHQTGWTGVVAKLLQPRRREPKQAEREDA